MAKVQGKKAVAAGKKAAKKAVARVKSAVGAAKKKVAPKKAAAPPKPAAKKPVGKPVAKPAAKTAAKPPAKPAKKAAKAVKSAAKAVKNAAKKVIAKAKPVAKAKKPAPAPKPAAVKAVPKAAAPKAIPAPAPKPAAKTTALKVVPKALPPAAPPKAAPAPVAAPPAPPAPKVVEEKKRGRRARPRVTSSGAPAAAWLSTEKPRPASFIPAPARAEAPSAVAAPPASSDRLIRPDDVAHPAVRTVPVRLDIEQSAGRYYVIPNPIEVTVRVAEGIEWDFRYLGGADVSVEEIAIEFEKPSPFLQTVFRTRKPGGARPHRQMSDGALPTAAGTRVQYTVRAINQFGTELARTRLWVTVTA
jgi:hypothetical protein